MKQTKFLPILILSISLLIISCSSDSKSEIELVGTWKANYSRSNISAQTKKIMGGMLKDGATLEFKDDKTVTQKILYRNDKGTYELLKDKNLVKINFGAFTDEYKIENGELTAEQAGIKVFFEKQ